MFQTTRQVKVRCWKHWIQRFWGHSDRNPSGNLGCALRTRESTRLQGMISLSALGQHKGETQDIIDTAITVKFLIQLIIILMQYAVCSIGSTCRDTPTSSRNELAGSSYLASRLKIIKAGFYGDCENHWMFINHWATPDKVAIKPIAHWKKWSSPKTPTTHIVTNQMDMTQ